MTNSEIGLVEGARRRRCVLFSCA